MTEAESKWLPIESAPKDGSHFLGWEQHMRFPETYRWDKDAFRPLTAIMLLKLTGTASYFPATHWQPLPTPPNGDVRG